MRLYLLLIAFAITATSQNTNVDAASLLTTKGKWQVGFSTSGFGFAAPEHQFITINLFSPKIGYFFCRRI